MTAKDVISSQIGSLSPDMTRSHALRELRRQRRHILPVVDGERRYCGLYADPGTDPDAEGNALGLRPMIVPYRAVKASLPLSMLFERMSSPATELLAVVDDNDPDLYIGAIDSYAVNRAAARLFPQLPDSTELTFTCPPSHYSASRIARAVEDADAHLLNLNVTEGTQPDSQTTVMIRVNHSRGESVARSLARYGYDTISINGMPEAPGSEMAARVNELLHYLEV